MAKDILLDSTGDLAVENGDWKIGESVDQETEMILSLNAGELKQFPLLGPGLIRMMNGNSTPSEMRQRIRLHMQMDNKEVKELSIEEGATRSIKIKVEQR